jgi:predicted nucleotide-binding protein (sugar kinase/HSP70/actin superfamily)
MNNPKYNQWQGYANPPWMKKDKKKVTVLFNFVERRKSFFMRAYFIRKGYLWRDLGDHVYEDVRWGKEYGNRMECNPMYFTSGSLIRNLFLIQKETGLSKEEIVDRYVFLGGGGQCGPCRYGMYPQEYLKVVNDAGFNGFRTMIFSSDITQEPMPRGSAFKFTVMFKVNILIAIILADFMHVAECALRPYAVDKQAALDAVDRAENILLKAF